MPARPNADRPLADRLRRRFRHDVLDPFFRHFVKPARRRRNARRRYRPVFVSGLMGSGTTLLALSLAQRFQCAAVIEESGHEVAADSFLHVRRPDAFPSVAAYEASFFPEPNWSVEAGRRALWDVYRANAAGRSEVVIDKGPNATLVRTPFLHECFPDAHFVLVFRDPVATIEGFQRKWARFRNAPIEDAIRFYAKLHERFLADSAAFAGSISVISYEVLTVRYEAVLEALGKTLRLDPAPSRRRLATRANVEGQGIRNVRRNRIEVDPDANRKAYDRLPRAEIDRIRAQLTPLYARLDEAALLRAQHSLSA